ncbi:MAG: hypothetical protein JJT85_08830 [Chromatiales bacterium]|nr:hypothetical protein [Chromatiales bacterium]
MRGLYLLSLLLAAGPGWAAGDASLLDALQERISAAWHAQDIDGLEAARAEALAFQGEGEIAFLAGYYAALASFRIGDLVADNRRRARDAFDACIDELEALLDEGVGGELAAEGHALLAGCYGNSAAFYRPPRVIMRGNRAQRNLERAAELAADNPRVILQDALSDYSRPAMFGGDVELAAQKLDSVAGIFDEGRDVPAGHPTWGAPDTWLYIGRIRAAVGDTEGASAAFSRALELAPDFRLARQDLDSL